VGAKSHVAERVAAFREAGASTLLVQPVGPDPAAAIAELRSLL
jgi:hypothetical protein